jgi:hypothetical protein
LQGANTGATGALVPGLLFLFSPCGVLVVEAAKETERRDGKETKHQVVVIYRNRFIHPHPLFANMSEKEKAAQWRDKITKKIEVCAPSSPELLFSLLLLFV